MRRNANCDHNLEGVPHENLPHENYHTPAAAACCGVPSMSFTIEGAMTNGELFSKWTLSSAEAKAPTSTHPKKKIKRRV